MNTEQDYYLPIRKLSLYNQGGVWWVDNQQIMSQEIWNLNKNITTTGSILADNECKI